MEVVVCIIVIFALICVTSFKWEKLVFLSLAFLVLEGVFRKWVLPQASELIYFIKDFLLIVAYTKFYFIKGRKIKYHSVNILIYLLALWSFVQIFNPSLGSIFVGLVGLKSYILYIPLFWMLSDLFPTKFDVYKFIRNYSLIVIPVCSLAIAQFFSPPSSPLNVYATAGAAAAATFGVGKEEIVRVTGTFSYISGFGTYLCASLALIVPLITISQPVLWSVITIIELLLILGTTFMTGSRAVALYAGIFLAAYLIILSFKNLSRFLPTIKKFIIPAIVVAIIVPLYFSKSIDLLYLRSTSNAEEGSGRFTIPFTEAISGLEFIIKTKQLDSYGTGASNQAATPLRKMLNLPQGDPPPPLEVEPPRVAVEIGVVGFFAWYSLRISLILYLLSTLIKIQDPFLLTLALSAFLFHALQLTIPVVFNPTMSIYYWFFSGFIILLPELEMHDQNK